MTVARIREAGLTSLHFFLDGNTYINNEVRTALCACNAFEFHLLGNGVFQQLKVCLVVHVGDTCTTNFGLMKPECFVIGDSELRRLADAADLYAAAPGQQ